MSLAGNGEYAEGTEELHRSIISGEGEEQKASEACGKGAVAAETPLPHQQRNVALCSCLFIIYMGMRTGILEVAPLATTEIFRDVKHESRWYEPNTLPFAAIFIADVLLALPNSWFMSRYGYRASFMAGGCVAAFGCAMAGTVLLVADLRGPSVGSYWLLSVSGLLLGPFSMTEFARFAAASASPPAQAARAMAAVVSGAFLSSLTGPGMVTVGTALAGAHAPPLRQYACFYYSCVALCILYVVVANFLRLPPRQQTGSDGEPVAVPSKTELMRRPGIQAAVVASFGTQWCMVLVMAATPHAMTTFLMLGGVAWQISTVIGAHMFGMFATGFVSGEYHAKVGTVPMMATGWVLLLLGIVVALLLGNGCSMGECSIMKGPQLGLFYLALVSLGVGWHFAFIGASKLLLEHHAKHEQGVVQGINEQLRFIANTVTILLAGSLSWTSVNYLTFPVFVFMVLAAAWRVWAIPRPLVAVADP